MSQSNIHASKFKEALNEIHACLKYDNNVEVYGFADKYHELSKDDIEELLIYADYEQKEYDWAKFDDYGEVKRVIIYSDCLI